jgi:ribosomal protein S8
MYKYNYSVSYVINLINIHAASKSLTFNLIFTKKNFLILKILKNLNFIQDCKIITFDSRIFVQIRLYYFKKKRIGYNFKVLSTPSKRFYISFKAIKLLSKRTGDSIFLISTTKGYMPHKEIFREKTGGLLIGFFSY